MNPYDRAQSTRSKVAMAVVIVAFGLLLLWMNGVI